jgi:uncharacterized protein
MFFGDMNYIWLVLIPTILISGAAQFYIRSAYSRWSRTPNQPGLAGPQVAQRLMNHANLGDVRLEQTQGQLSDHYDPSSNVVRMSPSVAQQPSVASMAIVAHELGHAQQYQERSPLIQMRQFLLPAVQISPTIAYGLIFAGIFFQLTGLAWIGIAFFGLTVLFMLLTLPVEFDASRRGLQMLRESGVMTDAADISGARQMLTAAALTYVAAAVTAVFQLLYYISLVQRRR